MKELICAGQQFLLPEENPVTPEISLQEDKDGVRVYRINWHSETPIGNLRVVLPLPMLRVLNVFLSTCCRDHVLHQWWAATRSESRFYFGAPFLCATQGDDINYALVALSDAVDDNCISFGVNDFADRDTVEFNIDLLTGRKLVKDHSVLLRVDTRELTLTDSMKQLSDWWLSFYPLRAEIPEDAEEPLYSSWYNYHTHPSADSLRRELTEAAEMGFKTVILDDGWQYDGDGDGSYSQCGDWHFSGAKFPDARQFMQEVHDLGLKLALWFCVPYVGWHTEAYQKYKNKLLLDVPSQETGVLDVRYADVREHIVNTLCDFVEKTGLDGLKLDFIDAIRLEDDSPAANEEMDVPDLSQAVIRLLTDLEDRLKVVCPGALLEYRHNYIGPAITRFGNMLRVGDCAFDCQINRRGIADLRLLHHPIAVHSDMLYWSPRETPENCGRQLANILFGVPQISVLLQNSTAEQKAVITRYVRYWKANKQVLMHGKFITHRQDMDFPILEAVTEEKRIVGSYAPMTVPVDGKVTDIWNGSEGDRVVVRLCCTRNYTVEDCFGKQLAAGQLAAGMHEVTVPVGGTLLLK